MDHSRGKQHRAKQERVVEAVRLGYEGDTALEFIRQSGFALSQTGLVRHLRAMGGRGHIQTLIEAGKTNLEILHACFPDDDSMTIDLAPPNQGELFAEEVILPAPLPFTPLDTPLYPTTKLTLRIPADLYEAIRIAARIENVPQNQLIVDILTQALSRMPGPVTE